MVHLAAEHNMGQVYIQSFEFLAEHLAFGVHKQRMDLALEPFKIFTGIAMGTQRRLR